MGEKPRFIPTERKRRMLNEMWRQYDRALIKEATDVMNRDHDSKALRTRIENFVYDNGETPEDTA